MKEEAGHTDSSSSETMAARIEIKELGDPTRQKEITDAIVALYGVIEAKIENDALHVSYDPLATNETKIEQAVRSTGSTVKAAATDTGGRASRPAKPGECRASSRRKYARRCSMTQRNGLTYQ
jgi:copper chaperone CopZ